MRPLAWSLLLLLACGRVEPLAPDGGRPETDPDAEVAGSQPLAVTVVGSGVVRSTPAAIDCGATCRHDFAARTAVTLDAVADAGTVFLGWEGDCSGTAPCVVIMDAARNVTARFVPHGTVLRAQAVGGAGTDTFDRIATDSVGNLIVAGTAETGNGDLSIVKLAAADGAVIWARTFATPPPSAEAFGGLGVDEAGHVYVTARLGSLGSPTSYDDKTATGDQVGNILVLKLDAADGHVIWAKSWGGLGQDIPTALVVAGEDFYVAGSTSSNPAQFDGKSFVASSGDGFLVRGRTSDGNALEARLLDNFDTITDLAVNGNELALVGVVRNDAPLGTGCTLVEVGDGADLAIVDVSRSTLVCLWGKTFGDSSDSSSSTMEAVFPFPGGGWVVGGAFVAHVNFAGVGSPLEARGGEDGFVARFTQAGAHVWSLRYGGDFDDAVNGVRVTPTGEVIVGGVFDDSITIGGVTLTGSDDVFVVRLGTGEAPVPEWAISLGGEEEDRLGRVALAPSGTVYAMAGFTGLSDVGGIVLSALGSDAWVAALVP
jgi:Divergent InlB B-repeat domain